MIDECLPITDEQAYRYARELAKREGIPAGISSGATCAAALQVARRESFAGKTVVVFFASSAERYLSTPLYRGLLDEE